MSDEDMENNYMFVMLWNFSVISHLIFPQCFVSFLAQNLKMASEAIYVAFYGNTIKKTFFLNFDS